MVYDALRHYADAGISCRFVSNVDPADLVAKLAGLDPATTLFIVASKTFSTLETLTNATAARRWLTDCARRRRGGQALRRGVDEQEARRRLRHQHRQHVRLLGLGRRPLLGRLGDRPFGDGGHRQGAVRRVPRRLPHRRRTLPRPHRWTRMRLRCLGLSASGTTTSSAPSRARCCRTPTTCPGSPPTCSS